MGTGVQNIFVGGGSLRNQSSFPYSVPLLRSDRVPHEEDTLVPIVRKLPDMKWAILGSRREVKALERGLKGLIDLKPAYRMMVKRLL